MNPQRPLTSSVRPQPPGVWRADVARHLTWVPLGPNQALAALFAARRAHTFETRAGIR